MMHIYAEADLRDKVGQLDSAKRLARSLPFAGGEGWKLNVQSEESGGPATEGVVITRAMEGGVALTLQDSPCGRRYICTLRTNDSSWKDGVRFSRTLVDSLNKAKSSEASQKPASTASEAKAPEVIDAKPAALIPAIKPVRRRERHVYFNYEAFLANEQQLQNLLAALRVKSRGEEISGLAINECIGEQLGLAGAQRTRLIRLLLRNGCLVASWTQPGRFIILPEGCRSPRKLKQLEMRNQENEEMLARLEERKTELEERIAAFKGYLANAISKIELQRSKTHTDSEKEAIRTELERIAQFQRRPGAR